jgi:hypothetical protein
MSLRIVPENPDPTEFPVRRPGCACDVRPRLCSECRVPHCAYGFKNAMSTIPPDPEAA